MHPTKIAALALALAACSCRLPQPEDPAIAAYSDARSATVRIDLPGLGMGTGFIVGPGKVVTAGHVCTPGALHLVTTRPGDIYLAEPVYDSDDSPQLGDEDFDACVLDVYGLTLGPGVKAAKLHEGTSGSLPLGAGIYYVGYPAGEMAAIEGRLVGFGESRFSASLWGWFGASGSAVWLDGRVIGILVSLNPRFPQITNLVDLDTLRWVLDHYTDPLAQAPGYEAPRGEPDPT